MSSTDIQWTNATWNPVRGCSRVSPGCDNCYAMRQAHRFSGPAVQDPSGDRSLDKPAGPYHGLTVIRKGKVDWRGHARLVPEMLDQPLRWRKPRRIFVNSMSDLFHSSLTDEEIAAVFGVMAACPHHTFQILTKRPERMVEWFKWIQAYRAERYAGGLDISPALPCAHFAGLVRSAPNPTKGPWLGNAANEPWPLRNVWLGVSVENQATADERIPLLKQVTAAVRFISAEPLLERIDLKWHAGKSETFHMVLDIEGAINNRTLLKAFTENGRRMQPEAVKKHLRELLAKGHKLFPMCNCEDFDPFEKGCRKNVPGLDWVIVGGESGHGARECEVSWIRNLVRQCSDAKVPVFVKQLGAHARDQDHFGAATEGLKDKAGGNPDEWPDDLQVRQFPSQAGVS